MFHVPERTHTGLQLMTSLAGRYESQAFVSLQTIAEEQGLSQGYLEEIAGLLRRQQLIEGRQGPGGGYRLHRPPAEIRLADITEAIEGKLMLVDCQKDDHACAMKGACKTKMVWQGLHAAIQAYLQQTCLLDVL